MLGMKYRIWQRKCLLLQIQRLEEGSVARMVVEDSDAKDWPGLAKEVREICKEIDLPDIIQKQNYVTKEMIKKAVFEAHYKSMKQDIDNSRKLEDVKHKEFRGVPEYFCDTNLKNARLKFKIRTKMVKPIPGNFQNKYRNTRRYGVSDPTILAYGLNLLPCPALNLLPANFGRRTDGGRRRRRSTTGILGV
jgi:hypothetical protein